MNKVKRNERVLLKTQGLEDTMMVKMNGRFSDTFFNDFARSAFLNFLNFNR